MSISELRPDSATAPPYEKIPQSEGERRMESIRSRSLGISSQFHHGVGTRQKYISGIQRVIDALKELCEENRNADSAERENIRRKAYSQLAFYMAYEEPDLFASQAGTLRFPYPREDGSTAYYHLDETIDFGGGLKAFGFIGAEERDPPMLLFHGTHLKMANSGMGRAVIADLDPFGIGITHFRMNQEGIKSWLAKSSSNGRKRAMVLGHSLGGSFAIYTGVYFAKYVKAVRSFHSPTVDSTTLRKWELVKKRTDIETPDIETYHSKGDKVSKCGHGYLVGKHFMVDPVAEKYKGVHGISLFVKDKNPTVSELTDIDEKNKKGKWGNKLISTLSFIPALPIIVGVGMKKLLVGARSWDKARYGLFGLMVKFVKLLISLITVYQVVKWAHQWYTEKPSGLWNSSQKRINSLFLSMLGKNKGKNSSEKIEEFRKFAEEKFSRGDWSLTEFSHVYLSLALMKNHESEEMPTSPLKVRLMCEVASLTFPKEIRDHVRDFSEKLSDKHFLHYLYHEKDFLRDLKKYLLEKDPRKKEKIEEALKKCEQHMKKIREFNVFGGKDSSYEPSAFEKKVREQAAEWKKELSESVK